MNRVLYDYYQLSIIGVIGVVFGHEEYIEDVMTQVAEIISDIRELEGASGVHTA